jgi:hypothetical protein
MLEEIIVKIQLEMNLLNKVNENKCIMVVVRGVGQMAENSFVLDFFVTFCIKG